MEGCFSLIHFSSKLQLTMKFPPVVWKGFFTVKDHKKSKKKIAPSDYLYIKLNINGISWEYYATLILSQESHS